MEEAASPPWGRFRPALTRCFSVLMPRVEARESREIKIESYPPGYPQYAALIATENSFHICRRFSNLRARLLLLKQDNLSRLEKQLEDVDRRETLFLGCTRLDRSVTRQQILSDIDVALADYDATVERNDRMLRYDIARARDVRSLQNWINNTGCLARAETEYLTYRHELVRLASPGDGAAAQLESWLEECAVWLGGLFRKRLLSRASDDPDVHIPTGSSLSRIARASIAAVLAFFLLAPALVCNFLTSLKLRTVVVAVATGMLIVVLAVSTRAKTVELFIAATAYTTLLVVFITNASPITTSSH